MAQLESISLAKLQKRDTQESGRLFNACCQDGIFYLDMSDTSPKVLPAVDEIYRLQKELFNLPEESLLHYDIDNLSPMKLNGYKPLGRNRGDLAGKKDGFQSYALPKDGILQLDNQDNFPRPPIIDAYLPPLHTFITAITSAASTILSSLSTSLSLPSSDDLRARHLSHLPSPDLIRLLKYHAQPFTEAAPSHIAHTDLGSLTFLFTEQYGLQVFNEAGCSWRHVQPRKGFATVNVGDCLSVLSNKVLRSCRHRVKALPGQALEERHSFAYFMRPGNDVLMRPLTGLLNGTAPGEMYNGDAVTSGEWLSKKYAMLRGSTWKKEDDWVLRGA